MAGRFKPGDRVVVRADNPPGHIRTPTYLRGKRGVILRDFGLWPNPEQLAYGKPGWPRRTNYWVQFAMADVWGAPSSPGAADTVVAEIYDHWLEPDPAVPGGA